MPSYTNLDAPGHPETNCALRGRRFGGILTVTSGSMRKARARGDWLMTARAGRWLDVHRAGRRRGRAVQLPQGRQRLAWRTAELLEGCRFAAGDLADDVGEPGSLASAGRGVARGGDRDHFPGHGGDCAGPILEAVQRRSEGRGARQRWTWPSCSDVVLGWSAFLMSGSRGELIGSRELAYAKLNGPLMCDRPARPGRSRHLCRHPEVHSVPADQGAGFVLIFVSAGVTGPAGGASWFRTFPA